MEISKLEIGQRVAVVNVSKPESFYTGVIKSFPYSDLVSVLWDTKPISLSWTQYKSDLIRINDNIES